MLSDSEKEKIEAQEVFRQEIRSDLEKKQRSSGLWKFLNSAFGIFLLSSVVVGGISFSYKEWKNVKDAEEKLEQKNERNTQIRSRLRAETVVRLGTIHKLKSGAKEYESLNVLLAFWGNAVRTDTSLGFQYYHLNALFSDYKEWTIFELLAELKIYETSPVRDTIDDLFHSLRENANQLTRGINKKDRMRSGAFLDKGKYSPRTRQYSNRQGITSLRPEDLPLVRYYYANPAQEQLMDKIERLLNLLEAAE